jgi:broad specificity phosphatase PhoE
MSATPEKIVYFIRHGQSEGNITPVFQTLDSPLSEAGRAQAAVMAERIAKLSFEKLIASPLPRTRDTAEAITKVTGKVPEYSELFVERVKPTRLGGKSYEDKEADVLWTEWEKSLYTSGMRVEDGENFDDLLARADKALEYLEAKTENTLVVVTHGFFLRTLIARVLLGNALTGEAHKNFQSKVSMENTGISVLKYGEAYEGGNTMWRLWIYNDHAHLG